MAKKLFVGNLPYQVNEDNLKELFSEFGNVESATIITDKYSGKSRGFGFVEMSNDQEAETAIENLNGHELNGRKMVVNEARPPDKRKKNFFRKPKRII